MHFFPAFAKFGQRGTNWWKAVTGDAKDQTLYLVEYINLYVFHYLKDFRKGTDDKPKREILGRVTKHLIKIINFKGGEDTKAKYSRARGLPERKCGTRMKVLFQEKI